MPWNANDLTALSGASEIALATERPDGTTRRAVPIWVVRVGNDLYIRSYNGPGGSWYHQARRHPYAHLRAAGVALRVHLEQVGAGVPGVDEAYWTKYGRRGYGAAMTTPDAATTTQRLEPA